jgi:hypothetical protein
MKITMKTNIQDIRTLNARSFLECWGKVIYSESKGCFCIIKFQNDFIREFPQLSEKRSSIGYCCKYGRNPKETEKILKDLLKQGINPVLMFLYRDYQKN